jgi:enterochelin esterase-like enzyme
VRHRLVFLVVLLSACSGVIAVGVAARQATIRHGIVSDHVVHSRALEGALHYEVWTPPGYATSGKRYPVIYVLHGLPGNSTSFKALSFFSPTLDRMDAQAIVVSPQGARGDAPDDEYQDLAPGREWETALTQELPAVVASHYRTLPGRNARAIVGVSAGGYGAMSLGLHHLAEYRVVESWSGYFHATSPDGSQPMQFAQAGKAAYANLHTLVHRLAKRLHSLPTLIAFYTGSDDPYPGFTAENKQFDRELASAGVAHRFAVYPGGHDGALWNAHLADWLGQALRTLTAARS